MIEIKHQLTVNAPIDEVWRVLALEFTRVGDWASGIAQSKLNPNVVAPEGAEVGGRVCSVPGFGDLAEAFTAYDPDNYTFSYEAIEGMPFFVKTAGNTWSLTAQGNQTIVNMHLIAEVNVFSGMLMAPMMRRKFDQSGRDTIEDLKYYVENGSPSPRKLKAMQQAA